ncbi:MAG: chain-length determining protein [Prevotella sp.]|nr:chain-length determining protein [Prevotella sp.]
MDEGKKKLISVNILDVITLLKKDKRKLIIYSCVAAAIGVVVALSTPKTYDSSVTLAPEESGAGFSGSISSLASMVGMNMRIGQTGDALYPEIYPDVMSSPDFLVSLFPIKVKTIKGDVSCDYYTYLTKHQKSAITDYPLLAMQYIVSIFSVKNEALEKGKGKDACNTPLWLTKDQYRVVKSLSKGIQCAVDKKTNVITIKVTDQDPLVAALVADSVKQHLQVAITEYKTKKACNDLQYMQRLFEEARSQYDKARQTYAAYADANQEVTLQAYKMKADDLENDMQLKYNIYTQVVEQLQLAKAKVQERTPAFTVIESAAVPLRASSKSRASMVITYLFFGFFLRFGILVWKNRNLFIHI